MPSRQNTKILVLLGILIKNQSIERKINFSPSFVQHRVHHHQPSDTKYVRHFAL
jgi:hypothetical protein